MFKIVDSPVSTSDSDSEHESETLKRAKRPLPTVTLRSRAKTGVIRPETQDIVVEDASEGRIRIEAGHVDMIDPLDDTVEKLMKQSVIKPGHEKNLCMTPVIEGKRAAKRVRKSEKSRTTGKEWFNMVAPEMTEERLRDVTIMKHRAALDNKTFYKSNDRDTLPKYFQIGTVVSTHADYYGDLTRKAKKHTIADELLHDAQMQQKLRKQYRELKDSKYRKKSGKQ